MFLLLSLGRYFYWWTINPRRYHHPLVSVSVLTCCIIYLCYWSLQFQNKRYRIPKGQSKMDNPVKLAT